MAARWSIRAASFWAAARSVNGMIYMRGQAADYDHWRQLGNTGWSWEDVLPYFRRSEAHHGGESDMHGASGEWRVARQRLELGHSQGSAGGSGGVRHHAACRLQ